MGELSAGMGGAVRSAAITLLRPLKLTRSKFCRTARPESLINREFTGNIALCPFTITMTRENRAVKSATCCEIPYEQNREFRGPNREFRSKYVGLNGGSGLNAFLAILLAGAF
jgi:hypothetical protein